MAFVVCLCIYFSMQKWYYLAKGTMNERRNNNGIKRYSFTIRWIIMGQ